MNPGIKITDLDLGGRSCRILSGTGAIRAAATPIKALCPAGRLLCISDETVAGLHQSRLAVSCKEAGIVLQMLLIPPGEAQKSFARLQSLLSDLLDMEIERGEAIAAFGGGVVGDLAGFASAILKRGTPLIQIPTTLLAQVDSSIGGKTAINMKQGKNLVGAFHQPTLVIADSDVLQTLPQRQLLAGYAEILKAAALADRSFFAWLEIHGQAVLAGDRVALSQAVMRAVAIKAKIVQEDERESAEGKRALLNLGHSFAHALESLAGYDGAILHGEAVAAGMGAAFAFSVQLGLCPPDDYQRLQAHLRAAGLPASLNEAPGGPYTGAEMIRIMHNDKKNRGGVIYLVLARALGMACLHEVQDVSALTAFLDAQTGHD